MTDRKRHQSNKPAAGSRPKGNEPDLKGPAGAAAGGAPTPHVPAPGKDAEPEVEPEAPHRPAPEAPKGTGSSGGASPPTPPPASPPPAGGGGGVAILALVVALAALGGSGYLWFGAKQKTGLGVEEVAQQAREVGERQEDLAQSVEQTGSELEALGARVDELGGQVAGQVDALGEKLEGQHKLLRSELAETAEGLRAERGEQMAELQAELAEQAELLEGRQNLLRAELTEQQEGLQDELDRQIERLAAELQSEQSQRQSIQQTHQATLDHLIDRLETLQLAQRGVLSELHEAKAAITHGDVNALTLAEVDYLLRLADHKLRLQRDPAGAVEALQIAEQRLGATNEMAFGSVLRMIREDIATVRAVELPDLSAHSARIAELEAGLEDLPLRTDYTLSEMRAEYRAAAEHEGTGLDPYWLASWDAFTSGLRQFFTTGWQEVKDLVRIRRERRDLPPLAGQEEDYFLVQNLRLQLEAARIALLRGDAPSYQGSLGRAGEWVQTYFDTGDEAVADLAGSLDELQGVELNVYIPDIGSTLRAFEDVMARRQPVRANQPPAEAAEPAEQAGDEEAQS